MKAAVHLGQMFNEHLLTCRNTNFEELKTMFGINQRLVWDQDFEILNVSTIGWEFTPWMRFTWLHDKVKWTEAKVHVYSDSVLCLERCPKLIQNGKISFSISNPLLLRRH